MDPFSIGAGALGSLESLTGGGAGPSTATNGDTNMGFNGGNVSVGNSSGNSLMWVVIALIVCAGVFLATKKG